MQPTVLSVDDIQKQLPILNNHVGRALLKQIFRILDIDKVNQIHANHYQLRGAEFTSAMLADPLMNVSYTVHNEHIIKQLPQNAFITVSNHPIGSLDGIILIDLFARLRPDFRVMVNKILSLISAMSDNFISITHRTVDNKDDNNNVNIIRLALKHLNEGHPLGFFPAGSMSFYNRKLHQVRDLTWTHSVIRLIRKANVPVFPVYFDCLNSNLFYRIGRLSWKLRTLFVAREAFNKQGQNLNVFLREPVSPEQIRSFNNDNQLANFLYNRTYNLL
jgi:hypothetical protein